jgi:hypothetical protein
LHLPGLTGCAIALEGEAQEVGAPHVDELVDATIDLVTTSGGEKAQAPQPRVSWMFAPRPCQTLSRRP